MVKKSGLGQNLYVGGFDLSGDVGQINNVGSPVGLLDVTGIDKLAVERIMGRRDAALSFTAFFNDATDQEHLALKGLPTTDVLALYLMSTTNGDQCGAITAKQINYDGTRAADGSFTFAVELLAAASFFLEWGIILSTKVSHASADEVVGIDFGSKTTVGAVGFLQAFSAVSGTVEYDIDDSSDSTNGVDGSWSTLLSFTDRLFSTLPQAERVAVDGDVERWTRAVTEGTFSTAVFAVGMRRRVAADVDAA